MMGYTSNPSTRETETGWFLGSRLACSTPGIKGSANYRDRFLGLLLVLGRGEE